MRTTKQLCTEKEFLRQFSQLFDEKAAFVFHRACQSDTLISSLLHAIYLGSPPFILAALYWLGLVLVEDNDLKKRKMIMYTYSHS